MMNTELDPITMFPFGLDHQGYHMTETQLYLFAQCNISFSVYILKNFMFCITDIDELSLGNSDHDTLFKRILRRFANMMSSETVRRLKRNYELQKSSALRQRLQEKRKKKAKNVSARIPSIADVISDPSPKSATHFALKAVAYQKDHSFDSLTAIDIKFIMVGYDLEISGNKKQLSEKLVAKLKSCEAMPKPGELTQEMYDNMKKKIINSVSGDQIPTSSVPNVRRGL